MYPTAFLAAQPPDDYYLLVSRAVYDPAFPRPYDKQYAPAYWAADMDLIVDYAKSPAPVLFQPVIACAYHFPTIPLMGIILGYSWTGNPVGCGTL
jgi:hypothetical protein